jgi:acyl carrier protein
MAKDDIAAIYPLSPVQQAFLLHRLRAGQSELGFLQAGFVLQGQLDISAFKRAWQEAMDRHPVLRTSFYWEDLDKPLQVVFGHVGLPWEEQDWRPLPPLEQEERLKSLLQRDRERGFDLSEPPLIRLTLVRVAEKTHQFIWSLHHVVLDGWSVSLVFKEVLSFYGALRQGRQPDMERPKPYRDYIAWLQQQDLSEAEMFWRRLLKGFSVLTSLEGAPAPDNLGGHRDTFDEQQIKLSVAATAALQIIARRHRITQNVLMQGAWALLLGRYSGENDVVFGATVSGRSASLTGIESMVGVFTNTLPVRVRISREASLLSWLKTLQDQQVELQRYENVSLAEIQEWSDVPDGVPFFESLLIFENYPWDGAFGGPTTDLEIHNFLGGVTTSYPLTIVVQPGPELSLQIIYDSRRFGATVIARILVDFKTLLESISNDVTHRISDLAVLRDQVPKRFSALDGQTNRREVAATDRQHAHREEVSVSPRTPTESIVAQTWQDLLGVAEVGLSDNFFDLGGYSLLALRAVSRLEKRLNVRINPSDLIFNTLRQVAAVCDEQMKSGPASEPTSSTRKLLAPIRRVISRVTRRDP